MNRLQDKVVVITGGVQGIGRGCALRMAEEGAKVVVGDKQEDDATAREIVDGGGTASHVTMDVRQPQEWARLIEETERRYGTVTALGNIAGVVNLESPDTVLGLTEDAWQTVIDTDLKGVWLGMQAVIPGMIEAGGGSIVNIASMAAVQALNNLASYSAAKGGVIALSQQAALEYGEQGIRVNCICPGTIDTPIIAHDPEMQEITLKAHLLKRLGKPADIAAVMSFFFADESAFCTAMTMPVDGGWKANPRNY
jgi:NAD(P)-dependent dehydrogenase (short-subunit alcohol dehydrogenase family)